MGPLVRSSNSKQSIHPPRLTTPSEERDHVAPTKKPQGTRKSPKAIPWVTAVDFVGNNTQNPPSS